MQTSKISAHPPLKKPLEEFILGAEQRKGGYDLNRYKNDVVYPWQEPTIRKDVQKVFTAKLPEEYILKIKYISEKTNKSQQKIIREIISHEIDKLLQQLT